MLYQEFIQSIIDKRGQWSEEVKLSDRCCERHHIIPACLGGEGDYINKFGRSCFYKDSQHSNCIYLYPSEHFIAHKLLAEENPTNKSLIYAYWNMCSLNKEKFNAELTPDEYERARILVSNIPGYWKNCSSEDHPLYGVDRSGKNNPFYGKTFSIEVHDKLSKNLKEWKETHPEEFSKNQSRPLGANGRAIPVICVETNTEFECIKLAVEWLESIGIIYNTKKCGSIRKYINTDTTVCGYHWISGQRKDYRKVKDKNHGGWKK